MKIVSFLVVILSFSFVLAQKDRYDKLQNSRAATIVQQEQNNNIGLGNYNFAFQSSDGIARQERAEVKNIGGKDQALVVEGSYSYIGNDGVTYTVRYIADENGYRAIGDHIPKN